MRVLVLQHAVDEPLGFLRDWLELRAVAFHVHRVDEAHGVAALDPGAFSLLVVLGGAMNVDDEATVPWLAAEKRFIAEWLQTGKHTLGVCLGSQLIAEALGQPVRANTHKEIGFWPLRTCATPASTHPALRRWPSELRVYHTHEQAFARAPPGCAALFESDATPCQGFARGDRLLAMQFHPEAQSEWIRGIEPYALKAIAAGDTTYVQMPEDTEREMERALPVVREHFFNLLDDFVAVP